MKKQKRFWEWKNQEEVGAERVLELYGTIAETSWFDDDVTPKMFHDELFAGSGPVTIWLNSPGGDCIAASQIYTMLMDYKDDVTIKIDGIAASAASVIAMAGTRVLMAPTALIMIHNPMTMAYGNGTQVSIRLTQAETLSLPDNRIAKVQLRVILGGSVSATEVLPVPTKELLHREELTANAD